MNAPAKQKDLAPQSAYQLIAIDDIAPSETHIQQLRRHRFDPTAMAELAKSITAQGVLQPIVVRRRADTSGALWEIVAGERRWIGARSAKLQVIPAVCRELTDLQVLEIQLIENLQREGLHPLEEAEGFADLMRLKDINAEAIAETIGRSRSHVFGRLKLLALQPDAREAFNLGELDASRALELARITDPKKQAQVLKLAVQKNWRGDGPAFSVRALREEIAKKGLTRPLDRTPFDLADTSLLRFAKKRKGVEDCEALPTCIGCPMRAGAGTPEDPDVCTDVGCYDDKAKDLQRLRRLKAEAAGKTIIKAETTNRGQVPGYLDLDDEADHDRYPVPEPEFPNGGDPEKYDEASPEYRAYEKAMDDWQKAEEAYRPRTYRQILADTKIDPVLVEDKRGVLREMLVIKEAKKLLAAKDIELPWHFTHNETPAAQQDPAKAREEQERQRARQEAELAYRRRLLKAIYDKWKPPLKRAELLDIAEHLLDGSWSDALIAIFGETPPAPAKLAEDALARLIMILLVADEADNTWHAPTNLLALAKRLKLDPAKIRKNLAAEARAKDKPAKAVTPAKKKATKK